MRTSRILYENACRTGVLKLCNISQLPYKSSGDWIIDVNHNDQKLEKQD